MTGTFTASVSRTAEPRRGHMAYIGRPSRARDPWHPGPTHRAYSGPGGRAVSDDQNEAALARLARWHLYAGCDRAPLGWEHPEPHPIPRRGLLARLFGKI